MFSTVRIVTPRPNGVAGYGTGFFFNYRVDDARILQLLVTNKHVIKDEKTGALLDTGKMVFHVADGSEDDRRPSGRFFTATIDQFGAGFFQHPDDSVDLCAMPLNAIFTAAETQGIGLFFRALDETYIRTDAELAELDAVEDIVMFGYPNALWMKPIICR